MNDRFKRSRKTATGPGTVYRFTAMNAPEHKNSSQAVAEMGAVLQHAAPDGRPEEFVFKMVKVDGFFSPVFCHTLFLPTICFRCADDVAPP